MVRIQSKTTRKSYGRGKNRYSYTQHLMPFPAGRNEKLKPFLKKDLKFNMNAEGDTLTVSLRKQMEGNGACATEHSRTRF